SPTKKRPILSPSLSGELRIGFSPITIWVLCRPNTFCISPISIPSFFRFSVSFKFGGTPFYTSACFSSGVGSCGASLRTTVFFSRKKDIPFWNLTDAMALATPTGLGMGRLGNFMNGELFGRVSYVPWAMIFKHGGTEPRHPSQLYELFMEGILLFAALWIGKK